jgi:hypothetical protein
MRSSQDTRTVVAHKLHNYPPRKSQEEDFSLSVARVVSHRVVFIPMSVIQKQTQSARTRRRERPAGHNNKTSEQVQRLSVFYSSLTLLCCLIFLRISFIARLKKYKMQFSDIFFCSDLTDRFSLKVINRRGGTVAPSAGCTMSFSTRGNSI